MTDSHYRLELEVQEDDYYSYSGPHLFLQVNDPAIITAQPDVITVTISAGEESRGAPPQRE